MIFGACLSHHRFLKEEIPTGKKTSFWTITVVLTLFTFLALPMGVSAADFPYGINATGQYPFDDGDGTKDDPFLISTPRQLAQLAFDVAQDISYQGQYLKLTANLDLGGRLDPGHKSHYPRSRRESQPRPGCQDFNAICYIY